MKKKKKKKKKKRKRKNNCDGVHLLVLESFFVVSLF